MRRLQNDRPRKWNIHSGEMDLSSAILRKYLVDALTSRKELSALQVEMSPRFYSDVIRIMRGSVEAMRVLVVSPNIYYQRTIPRYAGEQKKVSAADPAAIDKIIDELYLIEQ